VRFPNHRQEDYLRWIKTLPCLVCGQRPVDPAHIRPRSLGSDDIGNAVPLCRLHHDEQEGHTAAFERHYTINLADLAEHLAQLYLGLYDWTSTAIPEHLIP
jgi:hypothetical protein